MGTRDADQSLAAFARTIPPEVWDIVNPPGIVTEHALITGLVATKFRKEWANLARARGGIVVGSEDGVSAPDVHGRMEIRYCHTHFCAREFCFYAKRTGCVIPLG